MDSNDSILLSVCEWGRRTGRGGGTGPDRGAYSTASAMLNCRAAGKAPAAWLAAWQDARGHLHHGRFVTHVVLFAGSLPHSRGQLPVPVGLPHAVVGGQRLNPRGAGGAAADGRAADTQGGPRDGRMRGRGRRAGWCEAGVVRSWGMRACRAALAYGKHGAGALGTSTGALPSKLCGTVSP